MILTEHFTLAELCASQTADRLNIDNTPPESVVINLTKTAHGLEMIRALVQCPVVVSSGYRSEALERVICAAAYQAWCRAKGVMVGHESSWAAYFAAKSHPSGKAADITAPGFGPAKKLMAAIYKQRAVIQYDQLLLEFAGNGGGWVHVSWADKPRLQALVIDHDGTKIYT